MTLCPQNNFLICFKMDCFELFIPFAFDSVYLLSSILKVSGDLFGLTMPHGVLTEIQMNQSIVLFTFYLNRPVYLYVCLSHQNVWECNGTLCYRVEILKSLQFYKRFWLRNNFDAVSWKKDRRLVVAKKLKVVRTDVASRDRRMMTDLFRQKLETSPFINVLKGLSQKRIKRFFDSALVKRISWDCKGRYIQNSHVLVIHIFSLIQELWIVHLLTLFL